MASVGLGQVMVDSNQRLIEELQRQIAERDQIIADKDQNLADKDRSIKRLEQKDAFKQLHQERLLLHTLRSTVETHFPNTYEPERDVLTHRTQIVPVVKSQKSEKVAAGIGAGSLFGAVTAGMGGFLLGGPVGTVAAVGAVVGGTAGAAMGSDEAAQAYRSDQEYADGVRTQNRLNADLTRRLNLEGRRATDVFNALFANIHMNVRDPTFVDSKTGKLYMVPVKLYGCMDTVEAGDIDIDAKEGVCCPKCEAPIERYEVDLDMIEGINAIVKEALLKLEGIIKHPTEIVVRTGYQGTRQTVYRLRDAVERPTVGNLNVALTHLRSITDVPALLREINEDRLSPENAFVLWAHLRSKVIAYNDALKDKAENESKEIEELRKKGIITIAHAQTLEEQTIAWLQKARINITPPQQAVVVRPQIDPLKLVSGLANGALSLMGSLERSLNVGDAFGGERAMSIMRENIRPFTEACQVASSRRALTNGHHTSRNGNERYRVASQLHRSIPQTT